ncbi:DUF6844 domain-containing protein [Roseomonas populi]|uniref:DUF6844 domain-containing protein n=1 Tax=Roseomonas populi TaxID=3121582 RepID=A0ABT1WYN4_9PROT|nr:hypothetical protein [Roseomonas pecuniae]MCR0980961.1 hypothetical protein [Roseomonas pecuniae]
MTRLSRRAALALGGAGLSCAATGLRAQPAGTDPSVASSVQAQYEAQAKLKDTIQEWIERSGLRDRPGTIVEFGMAEVGQPADHPEWVKLRALAYDQAVMDAQQKVVQSQSTAVQADTVARLFRAGQQEPPPFQPSDLERAGVLPDLARRLIGLAKGKLDNELRELGINPADFERTPEPQRHIQMAQSIRRRSTIRSFGELVGFMPVQTFESHDGAGNFTIGVVIAGSQRTKAVIQQILTRRGEFEPDMERARDIRAMVADRAALVDDFGVRLVYDQAGLPVIVSFAQWGIAYRGNDRNRIGMELDAAGTQARASADRQIAEFLAGSGQYTETSETSKEMEQAALRHAEGYVEESASTTSVRDALERVMQRRAQINSLTGLTTLTNWSNRHPVSGQQIIGCVRTWSAAAERDIRAYRDQRPAAAAPARPANPQGQPGMRTGRELMNSRDF